MRIYLTGATGYIGTALCRRLAADGHELRALVRPTSRTETLESLGVALLPGDVTDRSSMREGMSGCDWIVHAAAELDFAAPADRMGRANVEGSENVASLAYKLGVGRLLAISSIAVWGGSADNGAAATEKSPPRLPLPSRYSVTKRAGEQAIAAWAERGLAVNTVYPSLVYGPPGKKQGANALLRLLLLRRMPAVVGADRRASWIFLDDLVDGIVRVMERSRPGDGYILAGEVATVGEVVGKACELGRVRPPRLKLSPGMAGLLGAATAPLYRLRGRRSPLVRDQIRSLARHWSFDDAKARGELGWSPRSLDEGLPPTVEYLLAQDASARRRSPSS